MKIIFFGLLIAVVYGHGCNYNEPANVPSKIPLTDLHDILLQKNHEISNTALKINHEASIDENNKKIEEIEKELEERAKQISSFRVNMSNRIIPPMERSSLQKLLDIMVHASEVQEEHVADLKQDNEEHKNNIINICKQKQNE
ncbi:uncharacterized protein LOC117570813 [Drosophila albomicans]|uniref:Uncharacterized protein LOC117570813 n=1 Tax=Drosophila albomicans TaxID=7291 RepID=A0A9C6WJS3_DROAB|nr:uncharacterized protein LOC117570813 [Drosophila albomicans]